MAQVRSEQNDRALLLEVADQGNARRFCCLDRLLTSTSTAFHRRQPDLSG
jgi:hypothetical protein